MLVRRVRAALVRGRLDAEMREELEQHIELRRRQLIEAGLDPRDAASEARKAFGNATAISARTRDMRSFPSVDAIAHDVRFGVRLLRRTPLFTAVAVLSLATGIMSAVAVFNAADAVLFRSLEVKDPHQLRAFTATIRMGGAAKVTNGVDVQTLERIEKGADFGRFVGFRSAVDVVATAEGAGSQPVVVELVSANYFDVLGVSFISGRGLAGFDSASSAVISERLWQSLFTKDRDVLGRTVTLNGHAATVVGIVRTFRGLIAEHPADVFVPLAAGTAIDPTTASTVIRLVGRLNDGTTEPIAEEKLAALYKGPGPSLLQTAHFDIDLTPAGRGVSDVRTSLERPLWLGLLLVGVLLLVASVNTAGLLLSRFIARQTEFGVRAALGAGRGRLARQLVVEAVLLTLAAGAIGLCAGWLAAPLLVRAMPETGFGAAFELRFDWRLISFALITSLLCAGVAAALSLVRLLRVHPNGLLAGETRTVAGAPGRAARVLMAGQVACCLLLTVGAVAMSRSLLKLLDVPPGFDPRTTFVVSVNATGLLPQPDAAFAYHMRLHDRISADPRVAKATMAQLGPLTISATSGSVDIPGFKYASDEDRWTRMFFVGPNYFETLGTRLIAGRALTAADGVAWSAPVRTRVAVVNERFATFYFGGAHDAIGRVVNADVRIVGVAADAHYNTLREPPARAMFVPHAPRRASMAHIVRADGNPAIAIQAVREIIKAYDDRLRPRFSTADDLLGASVARERFVAALSTVLSVFAVLLASAGLYGTVAYGVSKRSTELAVRIALGARPRQVAALVLADPLRTTLIGIAAGIPASYLVMRSADSLLFAVNPFDPLTILICVLLLGGAAIAAAAWPARRAMLIDPVIAFRSE